MKLLFLDTETTGLGVNDRIIQISYSFDEKIFTEFINPGIEIPPDSSCIHGITYEDIKSAPFFKDSKSYTFLQNINDFVVVGHNIQFDLEMLYKEGIKASKYIDTLQITRHFYPELKQYKLQYLRYYFPLKTKETIIPHSSEGDVIVLKLLFNKLYEKNQNIEKLIELSKTPALMKYIPFGKYKGLEFQEVLKKDKRYFAWMERTFGDKNMIYTISYLKTKFS